MSPLGVLALGVFLGGLFTVPAWLAGKVAGMKLQKSEKSSVWGMAYLFGVLDVMSGAYGKGQGAPNPYK